MQQSVSFNNCVRIWQWVAKIMRKIKSIDIIAFKILDARKGGGQYPYLVFF